MAYMYPIAPQMKLSDKSRRYPNPHLFTEIPRSPVVQENVEWQRRYGLQDYNVVRVCLSFQLRDHPRQSRMGAANWLVELCLVCHNRDDHNGVGVVYLFHRQDGLVDGIGGVDADLIAAGAQGRV